MKKLIIIFLLMASCLNAAEMPSRLQGYWLFSVYRAKDADWVTVTNRQILLRAFPDRIEGGAEVWYIDKVTLLENTWVKSFTLITFKNKKDVAIRILYMKEADAWSATFLKNDEFDGLYYFRPFKKVRND